MKRLTICFAALNVALYLGATASLAQHGHGGGAGGGHGAMGGHGDEGSEVKGGSHNSALGGTKSPDQLLAKNKLSQRLQLLLPSNMTVQDAAKGFKNLGQFVAAVHVAHNLGIPFDQLKSMVTGSEHDSLGKAIHALRPDADAKSEAKKAKQEADEDINESNS